MKRLTALLMGTLFSASSALAAETAWSGTTSDGTRGRSHKSRRIGSRPRRRATGNPLTERVGLDVDSMPAGLAMDQLVAREAMDEPLDPEAKCYLPGVPRATYMPFPFQIIQGNNRIIIAYEFANASRIIYLDKKDPAVTDSFMGWSLGHWEGDTLVVDVTGLNDKTWFDRAGNFHSDELQVVERYTPRGPDVLWYEATIEDPKVFTRPWKMSFPIYRRLDKNAQLLEFKCVPFSEELLYGHLRKETNK